MVWSRFAHTATLLPDGRVLVSGGSSFGFANAIPFAEIYDPTLGTWSLTGAMSTSRTAHRATLLANGRVLVSGGVIGATTFSSAEIYDPMSGSWSPTGAMIAGRWVHTATRLADGRVLVIGGPGSAWPARRSTIRCRADWSLTGAMGTPRSDGHAAVSATAGWPSAPQRRLLQRHLPSQRGDLRSGAGHLVICGFDEHSPCLPYGDAAVGRPGARQWRLLGRRRIPRQRRKRSPSTSWPRRRPSR